MGDCMPEIAVYTVSGQRLEPVQIVDGTSIRDLKKQLQPQLGVSHFRTTLLRDAEVLQNDCLLKDLPKPAQLTAVQGPYRHDMYSKLRKAVVSALHDGTGSAADEIDRILAFGQCPDPEGTANLSATPLQLDAQFGKEEIASVLLEAGASTEPLHELMESPLRLAAKAGQAGMVRLLCQHGADVLRVGSDGLDPLASAVERNAIEAAQHLCEAGSNKSQGLIYALQYRHLELAQILCQKGARLHPSDAWQLLRVQLYRDWLSLCVPMALMALLSISWLVSWQRSVASALMMFALAETLSSLVLWLQNFGVRKKAPESPQWVRGGVAAGEALVAVLWYLEALDAVVALAMVGLTMWMCSTSLASFSWILLHAVLPTQRRESNQESKIKVE